MDSIEFFYRFDFDDGNSVKFTINLERNTLQYLPEFEHKPTDWALLDNNQCTNCTLNKDTSPFCPIAANLDHVLGNFKNKNSFDPVIVTVKTKERVYAAKTTIQLGLSSMLGIYMVSSGCPILGKLKPMVRFHLPFASVEETVFRSVGAYLIGQYFDHRNGGTSDWELSGLHKLYKEIQIVNRSMADRLRSTPSKDANINALIVLDVFAQELPYNIDKDLSLVEYLYKDI